MKTILNENSDYPIQPKDINAKEHFLDAFGNHQTEISAGCIVRMCQEKNGWIPFTKEEIDEFSGEDFWFNRLIKISDDTKNDFIVLGDDNKYRVTHEFVARCFLSSPAKTVA